MLERNIKEFRTDLEKIRKEVSERQEKFERSQKRNQQVSSKHASTIEKSEIGREIDLNNEILKNKFLKNAINILCNEIPDMKTVLSGSLQEAGIDISSVSRPISEKAVSEVSSKRSGKSAK